MLRLVRSLAFAIPSGTVRRIEGAGHAAPFDAPANFVQVIADAVDRSNTAVPAALAHS